jgi:hypothetical protein
MSIPISFQFKLQKIQYLKIETKRLLSFIVLDLIKRYTENGKRGALRSFIWMITHD